MAVSNAKTEIVLPKKDLQLGGYDDPDELAGEFSAVSNSGQEAMLTGGDWIRLSRYGDWNHGDKLVQVFDRQAANAIVRSFKGAKALLGRIFGASTERPIYQGHPDDPMFSARGHDNTTEYGHITDVEARDDGLYIKRRWTDAGRRLLNSGRFEFSPRWMLSPVGQRDGRMLASPYKLLSAGLVPRSNIPGSAANAGDPDPTTTHHTKMNTILKMLLSQLGFTNDQAAAVSNGSDDAPGLEEVQGKIDALLDAQKDLGEAKQKLATANAKLDAEKTAHEATRSQLAVANEAVASERKERAALVVANAIADKRLADADRDKEVEALCGADDFTAAANALQTREKVLPTGGVTDALGNRKGEMDAVANAAGAFEQKFRVWAVSNGFDLNREYDRAHEKFLSTQEGRKLWDLTRQPKDAA